jgi:hypothetical protein
VSPDAPASIGMQLHTGAVLLTNRRGDRDKPMDDIPRRPVWVALGLLIVATHLVLVILGLVPNLISRPADRRGGQGVGGVLGADRAGDEAGAAEADLDRTGDGVRVTVRPIAAMPAA